LNSKDRVKKALTFTEPDRVPVDYWADKIVTERLMKALGIDDVEILLKYLNVDFRFIEGTVYCGPQLNIFEDGSWCDIWGVRRKRIFVDNENPGKGTYEHVIGHPLAAAETVEDIEKYGGWPSPDWYDYSRVEQIAGVYPEFAVVCGGDRLNRTAQLKTAMYLRGMEQIMMDLALNSKLVEAITGKLVEYFIEYNRRIFEIVQNNVGIRKRSQCQGIRGKERSH
jgi:uroporphyrinogen decarboxylase